MTTFTLTIELGNEAMRARGDVGRALSDIAKRLSEESGFGEDLFSDEYLGLTFAIRDANGNTVGSWEVRSDV